MTSWWQTLALSFSRSARQARSTPVLAFGFPMVASVAMVAVFAQLVSRIGDLPGFPAASYVDWVAAGAVTMVPMTSAIFSGMALATDIRTGYLDRIRLLPVDPIAFLSGRVLFDGVRVLPAAAIVLGVATAFGAEFAPGPFGALAILTVVVLWSAAYNSLFLFIAARTKSPQAVQAFFPIFAPLTFLSSVWLPPALMPSFSERAAGINPVSAIADGIRDTLISGIDGRSIGIAVAAAVGMLALFQLLTARTLLAHMKGA